MKAKGGCMGYPVQVNPKSTKITVNPMKHLSTLLVFVVLLGAQNVLAQPRYATPETKHIIQQMIEAHGGLEIWQSAPTLSYEHEMIDPSTPDDPWLSLEVIEQGRRRIYQDWPLDGGKLAFDGENVWTENWGRGNPPGMMAFVSYFFLNLPWITQDDGVVLDEVRQGDYPEDTAPATGKAFDIVRMSYDPKTTGASPYEYYDLYIDPDTYLLQAVQYTLTYRPLMDLFGVPKDVKFLGPLFKVYQSYTDVDGLKLSNRYDTYRKGQIYGIHTVKNYSLKRAFDASRLEMPADAVIDSTFKAYSVEGQ